MTLFKTNRQAIAAQGTDILNATIGGNSRRASATRHGGILSGFTANPIAGQPAEGHVDPVQLEAALLPQLNKVTLYTVYNAQS